MPHQFPQHQKIDPRCGQFGSVSVAEPMRPDPSSSRPGPTSAEQLPAAAWRGESAGPGQADTGRRIRLASP